MLNRVTIIGIGLIGGSLALALKQRGIVENVVGCARTQDTLNIAESLGLIDQGFLEPEKAVLDTDLVVLCTPLSSYDTIAQQIAPHLKVGAVLTDVGSVKSSPTEQILSQLSTEQQPHFVPGHPIAGTEKSGPEAAFAELFENKMTILTPLENTDKQAIADIKQLWEAVGAQIEMLDKDRHDFIYAHVSHNVQLLSSCFGLTLGGLGQPMLDEIAAHSDINFRKFIRLIGSDTAMWRDIFLANTTNLHKAVHVFEQEMKTLRELIAAEDNMALGMRLDEAKMKRMRFHDVLKGQHQTQFRPSDYSDVGQQARVWVDIMPRLISCVIMEGIAESEFSYATGGGIHGFSKNIILEGATRTQDIFEQKQAVLEALDRYVKRIEQLRQVVDAGDRQVLQDLLSKAREVYVRLIGARAS